MTTDKPLCYTLPVKYSKLSLKCKSFMLFSPLLATAQFVAILLGLGVMILQIGGEVGGAVVAGHEIKPIGGRRMSGGVQRISADGTDWRRR